MKPYATLLLNTIFAHFIFLIIIFNLYSPCGSHAASGLPRGSITNISYLIWVQGIVKRETETVGIVEIMIRTHVYATKLLSLIHI